MVLRIIRRNAEHLALSIALALAIPCCNTNSIESYLSQTWVSNLREVSVVDGGFLSILDSLAAREIKCGHYKETLLWTIRTSKEDDDTYTMKITMESVYPATYGYFYIDSVLFVVTGDRIDDLFARGKTRKQFKMQAKIPSPEDYPVWIYSYNRGRLFLQEAWPFPCPGEK